MFRILLLLVVLLRFSGHTQAQGASIDGEWERFGSRGLVSIDVEKREVRERGERLLLDAIEPREESWRLTWTNDEGQQWFDLRVIDKDILEVADKREYVTYFIRKGTVLSQEPIRGRWEFVSPHRKGEFNLDAGVLVEYTTDNPSKPESFAISPMRDAGGVRAFSVDFGGPPFCYSLVRITEDHLISVGGMCEGFESVERSMLARRVPAAKP